MALQTNHTDFEVRSLDAVCVNDSELKHPFWYNLKYTLAGLLFGNDDSKIVINKSTDH